MKSVKRLPYDMTEEMKASAIMDIPSYVYDMECGEFITVNDGCYIF